MSHEGNSRSIKFRNIKMKSAHTPIIIYILTFRRYTSAHPEVISLSITTSDLIPLLIPQGKHCCCKLKLSIGTWCHFPNMACLGLTLCISYFPSSFSISHILINGIIIFQTEVIVFRIFLLVFYF
jgi:hypothetical protein